MSKKKLIGKLFGGDKVIWIVFFMLCIISIVEVFSASSTLTFNKSSFFSPIFKHAGTIFMGIVFAVVVGMIPCRYFKLFTPFMIFISVFTLFWVLVAGETINGANRVIGVGGLTFQPSEIAKGTMVLATAQILSAMQTDRGITDKKAMRYILIPLIPFAALIGKENLSTAGLLCIVIFLMMFIGRVPLKQLGKLMAVVTIPVALFVGIVMLRSTDEPKEDDSNLTKTETMNLTQKAPITRLQRTGTWKGRIRKFLNPKTDDPKEYDLDKDAQVAHANIAIVSSNIIGKGPGNSEERDFLSQAFSDFIYAIIIEEMGIIGSSLVVFLYIVLLFRTARIANQCENNFPAFLAMGIALLFVVQATFNMMVAVGLAPVTGQPLPLISKGGTSCIINGAYIGILLSVSRSAKKRLENAVNVKQLT